MKFALSAAICLLVSLSSAAVVTDKEEAASSQIPTHIIKLKAAVVKNGAGFDITAFIKKHYSTFQSIGRGKLELMNSRPTEDLNQPMTNIDIGQAFKAVVGSFNPSFVNYLTNLDDVEYVEPNRVYKSAILPAMSQPQPYSISQHHEKRGIVTQVDVPSWGIARVNQRDRRDLNSYTSDDQAGAGIHVYVLDSGIKADHPDFGNRAHKEASFIDYEDDADYAGHGTHVAGTIGGNTYGISKSTILHGVKILDRNGDGTTSALIQAISHIIAVAEPGRSIINLSLTGPRSQTIDDALSMAVREHGIPVFVSAGNSGDNACEYSPSANPDVFTVGASNENDVIPNFSSYGDCVGIYAPGTNITSAWLNDQSQTMDGTSMANPHVTGIAAMLMSEYNFKSPYELYNALTSIATNGILHSNRHEEKTLLAYNGPERS